MKFVFDPAKEETNIRKHGVDFSIASAVFADPLGLSVYDSHERGEHRYRRFGAIGPTLKLFLAIYTLPDPTDHDLIRIISIRAATRHERREYEEKRE